jgi:hypothetical protein
MSKAKSSFGQKQNAETFTGTGGAQLTGYLLLLR